MSGQASRFIGSIPGYYDSQLGPRIFADFARDLAARVAALAPSSVLELAAGTGIVTRQLRDALPASSDLLATDLNPPMLEFARQKFADGENIRFESADATDLPFADASFDAVVCQFGVMFFPDKQQSFTEVLRVLRPGGQYLFNVWGSLENNAFARLAHEVVAGFFPEDPPGFYRVPFSYHDADTIREAMAAAGFAHVRAEPLGISAQIGSASEFASGLVYGNPLVEEIASRGGDPGQIASALANALGEELGQTLQLQALVVHAVKH